MSASSAPPAQHYQHQQQHQYHQQPPPSPGATRAAGVLSAGAAARNSTAAYPAQQAFYPGPVYPAGYPRVASSSTTANRDPTAGPPTSQTASSAYSHHRQPSSSYASYDSQHTYPAGPTSYSPLVFEGNVDLPPTPQFAAPPSALMSASTRRASVPQEQQDQQSIATSSSSTLTATAPEPPTTDQKKSSNSRKRSPTANSPNHPGSTNSNSKKKPTRRYNASCDACRARKRKCPGRDPTTGRTLCTACADRGVECTYGSLGEPSRLRRADNENEKLRKTIANALQAETAEEKDSILATITERMLAASSGGGASSGKSRRSSEAVEDLAYYSLNKRFKEDRDEDDASASGAPTPSHQADLHQEQAKQETDDQNANVHTLTGVPSPRPSSDEETAQFTQALITSEQDRGHGDTELERQVSYYLNLALPHGDFQDAPSPHEDHRLLDFYFSWLNPRYALLSRKLFEQSRLMNDGVYCTPFLLWSLYAHSATHCPGFEQQQAHFRARAHLLLTKELCKGKAATLPLAQGLILLAGTAAARSDHSLAWTLSFTVTGMVIDLLENMDQSTTENERMMRKRLYWSHYVWTLVLALALNRKPSVPKLKVELPEGGDEAELWLPALPVRHVEGAPQIMTIPRLGHELKCFREICQLFSFLDEILSNVYVAAHDKRSPDTINTAVRSIQDRMNTWQTTKLSSNILINAQDLPPLCPPPHIIHFKAIWILLYRPFYNMGSRTKTPIKAARQACNQCASEIYAIFLYLEQNFGVLQLHFSYIYAAYWAATIDVASAKREGLTPDLLARLNNSSRILLTWVSLPGMKQSVSDLIEQIEALLLADVPRPVQASEPYSAYDPMHHPVAGQESMGQPLQSEQYYAQVSDMLRPMPQNFMISDPMMGMSPPVDYAPLGGIYWDPTLMTMW